ncbi:Protein of unknown function [Cotesia congregata]|uniref:Uncharacterized protein n=1 Tax=Cotesia congregata TaxID=51543 RepID=A0A8J2MJF7_COTCN|nr:Protein of unknown function [Cotesia congregata]
MNNFENILNQPFGIKIVEPVLINCLRRVTYEDTKKWVKIVSDDVTLKYSDMISAAKRSFNIDESVTVDLRDKEGTIIDEEVFELFASNSFTITTKNPAPKSTAKTNDGASSSSYSDDDSEIPVKKVKLNKFDLRQVLEKSLTPQSRITLIQLCVDALKEAYGKYPSKEHKILYAKEIILVFPNLKDKYSLEGWEAYYDVETRGGFLGNRLKNSNREENKSLKKVNCETADTVGAVNTPDTGNTVDETNQSNEKTRCYSSEEVEMNKVFLQNADCTKQRNEIKQAMKITLEDRRKNCAEIFSLYPRFLDIPYLIDLEFSLLFQELEIKEFCPSKIFLEAEKHKIEFKANEQSAPEEVGKPMKRCENLT